ncbi:MAG: hypothetical protein Q9190_003379 [Brigantiaea leucoxantha]
MSSIVSISTTLLLWCSAALAAPTDVDLADLVPRALQLHNHDYDQRECAAPNPSNPGDCFPLHYLDDSPPCAVFCQQKVTYTYDQEQILPGEVIQEELFKLPTSLAMQLPQTPALERPLFQRPRLLVVEPVLETRVHLAPSSRTFDQPHLFDPFSEPLPHCGQLIQALIGQPKLALLVPVRQHTVPAERQWQESIPLQGLEEQRTPSVRLEETTLRLWAPSLLPLRLRRLHHPRRLLRPHRPLQVEIVLEERLGRLQNVEKTVLGEGPAIVEEQL